MDGATRAAVNEAMHQSTTGPLDGAVNHDARRGAAACRAQVRRRSRRAALVACAIGWAGLLTPTARVCAQTLDLGGSIDGPVLPADGAAHELAEQLKAEAAGFERDAARLTAEAQSGMRARARLRTIASYLLQVGADRPWDESAAVAAGMRMTLVAIRADAVVAAACNGTSVRDGRPLTRSRLEAALRAVDAIGATTLDEIRAAAASRGRRSSLDLVTALAKALEPVRRLCEAVEDSSPLDCWPMLPFDSNDAGGPVARDDEALRPKIAALSDAALRSAVQAALDGIDARGPDPFARGDLALVADAVDAAASVEAACAAKPSLADASAASASLDAVRGALERLAGGDATAGNGPEGQRSGDRDGGRASDRLLLLERTAAMRTALEAMDAARTPGTGTNERKALQATANRLLESAAPDATDETLRLQLRALRRIDGALRAVSAIRSGEAAAPPRDLREFARELDRDARLALRSLPGALEDAAADLRSAEPAAIAAIDRVGHLAAERARLQRLQEIVDGIASIRPSASKGASQTARRIARLLLDPLKRDDAARAFAALDLQASSCLPFPFEDELKRATDRAIDLTGGEPQRVVDAAARTRARWADAVARGDLGGVAASRLVETARLLEALRDIDQLESPVDRAAGDRLSTWGPWVARRATLAPAMQDLGARTRLACRALVAADSTADEAGPAVRDLEQLATAIPLVRLVARLERRMTPLLRAPADTLASALAPLVEGPHPDSYLVDEWPRFESLARALLEHEGARRRGDRALEAALDTYLAALCIDLELAAFGSSPVPGPVPGFDGRTEEPGGSARDRRR
jgi:hypothetical protein